MRGRSIFPVPRFGGLQTGLLEGYLDGIRHVDHGSWRSMIVGLSSAELGLRLLWSSLHGDIVSCLILTRDSDV